MTVQVARQESMISGAPSKDTGKMERRELPFRMVCRRLPANGFSWIPATEMYQKENSFIIRMDLPGIKKEDVDISTTEDILTVKGDRKPLAAKGEEYHCEVRYGSFSRSFTLPISVDATKIEAALDGGVLEIRLPRVTTAKLAKVPIQ